MFVHFKSLTVLITKFIETRPTVDDNMIDIKQFNLINVFKF